MRGVIDAVPVARAVVISADTGGPRGAWIIHGGRYRGWMCALLPRRFTAGGGGSIERRKNYKTQMFFLERPACIIRPILSKTLGEGIEWDVFRESWLLY